ncbi:MAG: bacterio-opsin activator domain-containing protein [Halobacteriales archaeon]
MDAESAGARILFAGERPPGGPTPDGLAAAVDGFEVEQEEDFAAALDRVEDGTVDCVVASHREAGFDGAAFLEAVRREHAELPVVLVPENGDPEVARRAVAADATALVPATDDDALDGVADAVERNVATYPLENPTRMPISDLTVEAERRLKERALDEAPTGITISDARDPENPIIYANDSFVDITGYPHEETIGVNHRFLQGPDTDPEKVEELGNGIAEKRHTRVVLRNYTRDGTMFWNQIDVSPILDEEGEVTHYVGFQMDVTERERAKRKLEAEREALDRLLDRVNGLMGDVTEALVRAESREEIEELAAERVASGSEYAAAWLGRYDATDDRLTVVQAPGDETDADEPLDLGDDAAGIRGIRDAIEGRTARVVEDPSGLPAPETGDRAVAVPLSYRSTTYGVLVVYEDEDLLDDRERRLLQSLGRSIGTSINDVLTKRTMATDTVLNIAAGIHDDGVFLVDLAAELNCSFDHEATTVDDEGNLLTLARTEYRDAETLVETAEGYDDVAAAETLVADDDGAVVQFRLTNSPLVDVLSESGTRMTSMHGDRTSLDVEFWAGTERAARRALEDLRETYERVELLAYHEVDGPAQTARGFREELRSRLTDRQLTALRKAYVSGFFEWPRRAEGEQLADSMGIVPSTYHQHLQAAKRKLVGAFFEE